MHEAISGYLDRQLQIQIRGPQPFWLSGLVAAAVVAKVGGRGWLHTQKPSSRTGENKASHTSPLLAVPGSQQAVDWYWFTAQGFRTPDIGDVDAGAGADIDAGAGIDADPDEDKNPDGNVERDRGKDRDNICIYIYTAKYDIQASQTSPFSKLISQ